MAELYQRDTGDIIQEKIFGSRAMHFTYETKLGRLFARLVLKRKWVSKLAATYYKTRWSAKKIPDFIEQYGIEPSELSLPPTAYESFNAFFTRKLDRSCSSEPGALISPADSRLLVHKICDYQVIGVKGCLYSIEELLQDKERAEAFRSGLCLVFRLCPTDYHRFCFPDSGSWQHITKIKGNYNTVNTFFVSGRVHVSNYRETSILHTDHFGEIAFVEVGAMLIGKIVQTAACPGRFAKGQEKGYFEYGASTIVMLIKENCVQLAPDILEQSLQGRECLVRRGEKIGENKAIPLQTV